jgi:hypothetical protein
MGKKMATYRSCHTEIVRNGLPLLKDNNGTESDNELFKNYKKESTDSSRELSDIAYDISGDDAKRILKNILCWVDEKQKEMSQSGWSL